MTRLELELGYFYSLLWEFFLSANADGFLLVFEWQHISSSIQADLNNAVVWMVSTRPLNFKSSSPCTEHTIAQSAGAVEYCFSAEG